VTAVRAPDEGVVVAGGPGSPRLSHRDAVLIVVCALGAAAAALSAIARIFFGVDLTDEAFYAAMSWRFAHGAVPFVDESAAQQTAAVLTLPFVKVWSLLFSSSGLVLALRAVYLAFMGGVAVSAYSYLRRVVGGPFALVSAAAVLVYAPLSLPTLSYNTLGVGLLTAGCFVALATIDDGGTRTGAWAGLLHGLACVAYPTIAAPVALFGVLSWWLAGRGRRAWCVWYLGGVAVIGVAAAAGLAAVGFDNVGRMLDSAGRFGLFGGGAYKLVRLFRGAVKLLGADRPWLLPLTTLAVALYYVRRRAGVAVLFALPLAALSFADLVPSLGQAYFWAGLAFPATIAAIMLWRDATECRPLVLGVLVPALACGAVMAYTSSNDIHQAGVGLLGSTVVFGALLALAAARVSGKWWPRASALSIAAIVGISALLSYAAPYREAPVAEMTATVSSGPYAGIRTTPTRAAYLARLREDMTRFAPGSTPVLCYDVMPAGYLFSDGPGATPTAWVPSPALYARMGRDLVLEHFERTGVMPAVVVRNSDEVTYTAGDPLDRLVTSPPYDLAVARDTYKVYVRSRSELP
jgi:hypothetical protein